MPAFVPAWKKLGLQLKNAAPAPETEPVKSTTAPSPQVTKKRKADDRDETITSTPKEAPSEITPAKRTKITFQEDSSSTAEPAAPKTPISTQKSTQKTPKSILKKTKKTAESSASSQNPGDEAETNTEAEIEVPVQPPKTKAEKKAKRAARLSSQSNATAADKSGEGEEKPHLIYLRTYHETPESWKFNKNHQIQLLKDVFNLYRIPPSYNDALSSYIRGLQGAAARERLGLLARSITSEQLPAEKDGGSDATEKTAEKRTRAALIVQALEAGKVVEPSAPAANATVAAFEPEPKKKKSRGRKRRVEVESESSSSSESSDSSDSDDNA